MPGIEDLNFKVLLDDELFRSKINEDISRANNLNAKLSDILNLKVPSRQIISDKSVKNSEDLAKNLEEIKKAIEGMPNSVKIVTSGQMEHKDAVEQTNTALSGTEGLMRTIAQLTGVAFSVATIRRFVSELVTVTGQFEVQKMALGSMLQDLDKADEIFSELRKNALNSPYTFQDLTKFAKQLTAFNIPTDQLVETEKRLADVAAGLGVDMGRIILAYGQVKAAGALKGQELRQFTEAGVPILEQLAKQIEEVEHRTVSLSEVFQRVSKKQISFEMVEEAFRRMTSEGGKFYNMQEVLVNTLQGKIGKLRDVWQQSLYDMGMNNEELLKGAVDAVTKIVANLDELGKRIPELVTMWGAYKTTQIAVEVASGAFALANHKVLASLKAIGTWISKNPYALLAAAVAAVTIEAVRFGKQMYESTHRAEIAQKQFNEAVATATKNISNEREELRRLAMVAGNELNTMKQRTDAIDVINAQYGEYLRNLGIEKVSIDNLGTSYNALRDAIAGKYLAELKEQTVGKQQAASAEARAGLNAFNAAFIRNTKITSGKNAGKNYGAGGIGLIQGEIERFIDEHPMFDKLALTNAIANIYHKYGLEISAGSKTAGDLYKVVEDYVEAGTLLANAERDFNNFAKGYGHSLGLSKDGNSSGTGDGPKTWGDTTKKDREIKERISDIQREVQILERYLNKRKEAEKYLGEGASAWMASLVEGKDAEYFATLEKQISDLVAELKTLGDAGNDAADAINGRLGADALTVGLKGLKAEAKAAENAQKALDKYIDVLEKWTNKEKPMEGEGVAYKIAKAVADYRTAIAEAEKKYKDVTTMPGANRVGNMQSMLNMGRDQNAAKAQLRSTVLGYMGQYIKEVLEKEGYDLTNWNDKTLGQINSIKDALSKIELPGWVKKLLENSELKDLLNEAEETLEEEGGNIDDKTLNPEKIKKIAKVAKYAAKEILSMADSIGKLSDEAGESIEILGDFASTVSQGFSQGGPYGIVISAVAWMAKKVIELVAEEVEVTAEFERTSAKAAAAYNDTMNDIAVKSKDTVFGENTLGKIREYIRIAKEYKDELEPVTKEFNKFLFGADYINENGVLNLERVLADIENGVLSGDGAERIKTAITKYKDALEQLDSIANSVFGDIASSAADKIVEGWIEAGDAALDYADILDDVAKAYSKMLIQSMISETFLDPITEDVKKAFTDNRYEDAMALIAGAMDGIAESAPMFEDILRAFNPYFSSAEETADSLGSGIKSITEETASLLASYINAMRADLSFMRGLQERGWGSVELIGQAIPTLNDYMNQVAANTFDTAQNTQQILSELQSVIGAEGTSGSIVRVQMA